MDIVTVTTLLSSFLPSLLKLGDKAIESIGSAVGKDGWETAKKIWEKIHPKLDANEDVKIAAEQSAAKPESKAREEVFKEELATLIINNPDLAEAIAKILEESAPLAPSVQINQTLTNNEGQVIGQMTGGKAIGRIDGNIQGGVNL
jgi:transketolase